MRVKGEQDQGQRGAWRLRKGEMGPVECAGVGGGWDQEWWGMRGSREGGVGASEVHGGRGSTGSRSVGGVVRGQRRLGSPVGVHGGSDFYNIYRTRCIDVI